MTSARQWGQLAVSRAPHAPQNRADSEFTEPQLEQPIGKKPPLAGVLSLLVNQLSSDGTILDDQRARDAEGQPDLVVED